jgi:hypothetical protein
MPAEPTYFEGTTRAHRTRKGLSVPNTIRDFSESKNRSAASRPRRTVPQPRVQASQALAHRGALSAREDGDEDVAEETEDVGDTLVVPVPGRGPGREGGREVSMASMATGCSSMARALAVEEDPV